MSLSIKQTGAVPYMGIMAAIDAEFDNRYPAEHGVAWVHGWDSAPESFLGGGMTVHTGSCPVEVRPKMRSVIIKQGHKFCLLRIV